ncbi:MAG: branched-chain amino acid ABC transporter permease [Nitrososphaerales archaeon]
MISIGLIILGVLFAAPTYVQINYFFHFVIILCIYITLSVSWNIVGGYAGQCNFAHSAFFGAGAYTTALLWNAGLLPYQAMIMGAFTSALLAILITPCFRLRGSYFVLGTMSLSEILRIVMLNWRVSGGASGIHLPVPEQFTITTYYYVAVVLTAFTVVATWFVVKGKLGLAFRAIRDNEVAAESLGVNPLFYKVISLVLSAFFAGLIGGFYSYYVLFIEPNNAFSVFWTAIPLFATILGGAGTMVGPIVGAVIYVGLTELTAGLGVLSLLILGIVLIAIVIIAPTGLVGLASRYAYRRRTGEKTVQKGVPTFIRSWLTTYHKVGRESMTYFASNRKEKSFMIGETKNKY